MWHNVNWSGHDYFKGKLFHPENLLLLTLAVCSVALLNWRALWVPKWAGGDVEIMLVSHLHPGSLPGLWTRYFHIQLMRVFTILLNHSPSCISWLCKIQIRTHKHTVYDSVACIIHLLWTVVPWRLRTNCVDSTLKKMGGACTLHLSALIVPHFFKSASLR